MKLGKQKAKRIAKHWISSNITLGECFYSSLLTEEENEMVKEQCLQIVIKLWDENVLPHTDNIVKHHLNLKEKIRI